MPELASPIPQFFLMTNERYQSDLRETHERNSTTFKKKSSLQCSRGKSCNIYINEYTMLYLENIDNYMNYEQNLLKPL